MKIAKVFVGVIVAVVMPIVLGLALFAAGWDFDHQHVHDITAVLNPHKGSASVVIDDYNHNAAGIIAMCALYAAIWSVGTSLLVLWGSKMISLRNQRWG